MCFFFFLFFKQKTAYEMRISDWSSDVCSSDLLHPAVADRDHIPPGDAGAEADDGAVDPIIGEEGLARKDRRGESARDARDPAGFVPAYRLEQAMRRHAEGRQTVEDRPIERSEEHTSELQSLMRISYAVFCLKKKKKHN